MINVPGVTNASYLLPRFHAAKIPSTEAIEKESTTAVPARKRDQPNALPSKELTERG